MDSEAGDMWNRAALWKAPAGGKNKNEVNVSGSLGSGCTEKSMG